MIDVKVSKDKYICRWVDQENFIYVRQNKVISRGKRSKTLSEVKPIKTSKNLQSFLEISPVQKKSFFCINYETMHEY